MLRSSDFAECVGNGAKLSPSTPCAHRREEESRALLRYKVPQTGWGYKQVSQNRVRNIENSDEGGDANNLVGYGTPY